MNKLNKVMVLAIMFATTPFMASAATTCNLDINQDPSNVNAMTLIWHITSDEAITSAILVGDNINDRGDVTSIVDMDDQTVNNQFEGNKWFDGMTNSAEYSLTLNGTGHICSVYFTNANDAVVDNGDEEDEVATSSEPTVVVAHYTAGHRSIKANGLWVIRPMGSVVNNFAPIVDSVVEKFIFTKNLYFGIRNSDVTELQERLTSEGVYTGPVTGYFGTLTRAAAIDYQAAHSIKPLRGYVGPITRAALNADAVTATASVAKTVEMSKTIKELIEKVEILKKRIANL